MSLTLPRPPRFDDLGAVRRQLTQHLARIQLELEQNDRKNLKAADVATRTSRSFVTYTADTTVGQGQDVILVDASSAAVTITLPPAADAFKELCIKKIDATGNTVTLDGNASETIDDSTTLVLSSQYDAVRISSDGSEWWIL